MATVILFGGGDGGGLLITASGVRPIPPFDPAVLGQLRGISNLVQASQDAPDRDGRELDQLVNKLANLAVGRLEAIVGPLDAENGLVYVDDDGGFSCGSTGKPPIPIPWPPPFVPSLDELIRSGAVDQQMMKFVDAASSGGMDVLSILDDPAAAAGRLGVDLSEQAVRDLQQLSLARLDNFDDPVDAEVVRFFHRAVEDGQHLSTWATRPFEVSQALGVELSDAAIDRLVAVGSGGIRRPGGEVENPAVVVAVAVGVLIMLVDKPAEFEVLAIRDRSGRANF